MALQHALEVASRESKFRRNRIRTSLTKSRASAICINSIFPRLGSGVLCCVLCAFDLADEKGALARERERDFNWPRPTPARPWAGRPAGRVVPRDQKWLLLLLLHPTLRQFRVRRGRVLPTSPPASPIILPAAERKMLYMRLFLFLRCYYYYTVKT